MVSRIIRIISLSLLGFSIVALILPVVYFKAATIIENNVKKSQRKVSKNIPYESFVQMLHTIHITTIKCMTKDPFCPIIEKTIITRSKGSGLILGHSNGFTYILTAQHVCQHKKQSGIMVGKFAYEYGYSERIEMVTYVGDISEAIVISSNRDSDLCLLVSVGEVGRNVKIKKEKINIGDTIVNIGAPLGIFTPGMALTFDGRYSGNDGLGNEYFSIPGAPGSSGSPIFDSNGELVSIVHSAHVNFQHLALGCLQQDLINFLYKNRVYLRFLSRPND